MLNMSEDAFKLDLLRRPRRLRRSAAIRRLIRETTLLVDDLIAPLFVVDGNAAPEEVGSMPGVMRYNIDDLLRECETLWKLGICSVALFPKIDPTLKDARGSVALHEDGLILRAIRAVKKALPEMLVMTDVALDPYTNHGHDGVLKSDGSDVDNDATVEILMRLAELQADAGCDFVAPSDMMDGRIGAIRNALDKAGFTETGIVAYSAKFASAYYGPFRDAVGSASAAGTRLLDKNSYQLSPFNRQEALREAIQDWEEGADVLMVKPAGPYLDIVREVNDLGLAPVAAYQVSGEYAQIMAASKLGWLDLERSREESLVAIKRAGADMILTYFAKEMADALNKEQNGKCR